MTRGVPVSAEIRGRALALSDSGLTDEQIAVEMGVARRSVVDWRKHRSSLGGRARAVNDRRRIEQAEEVRLAEKSRMRQNFTRIVTLSGERVIEALETGKIAPRDAAWAGAVAFDKVRLLDNEPTAITADVDLASFLRGAGYEGERRKLRLVK